MNMTYQDTLTRRYDDPAFQTAFRAYFAEMGCQVSNWDGLFQGMEERGDRTWIRRDAQGQVIGFIMFCMTTMQSWFFEARYGFVTEFWVAPEHRGRGHGTALLQRAEASFMQEGCRQFLLTSDTAAEFYEARGYVRTEDFRAKNQSPVFLKRLPCETPEDVV